MSYPQIKALWAGLVVVLVCVALTAAALIAWKHEADQRQHDLCALVTIFTDPAQPPPASPSSRQSRQLERLKAYALRDCGTIRP